MERQGHEIQTGRNTVDDIEIDQAVHDAAQVLVQNTPTADVTAEQGPEEDVSIEEQQVGPSPEEAEPWSDEDADSEAEDGDNDSDDSAQAAEQYDAQVVADMNDLQSGRQQCYICTDEVCYSKVLQLGCSEHWLCHDCIADPFEQAILQESCYPPRCCDRTGPLRIEDFAHLLAIAHPDLAARYDAKLQEYHMDKRFRRYCAADDCKTFLNPESYEQDGKLNLTTADCPTCSRTTCVFCTKLVSKATPHECEPSIIKLNKDYSSEARFKYCPYCDRPGLLDEGCNHVTCECGEEWCFICLRKWDGGYNHDDCGQYNDPVYDEEGYDENGYHRDTGVDRQGYNRDGFNVAGFDREGNKVTDFARLERDRLHAPAFRPAGFLDLDDEFFEETAMILFISEREAGIVHETDDFEQLLAIRFPGFRGGGLTQEDAENWAHNDDGLDAPPVEDGGAWGHNDGRWEAPAVNNGGAEDFIDEAAGDWDHLPVIIEVEGELLGNAFADLDEGATGEDDAVEGETPDGLPAFLHDQGEFDAGFEAGVDQNMEDGPNGGVLHRDGEAAANETFEEQGGWGRGSTEEGIDPDTDVPGNHDLAPEVDSGGPQAPTAAQIQCQHNWDLAQPGNLCKACTLTCEEYAQVCTICSVEACGECAHDFAGNTLLNWPGADVVGQVQGEDQNIEAALEPAGSW
ncbi:hypothetical protein FKW77_009727 [Venturia effusa]|uniref:RBR-type E3 ubiquitin transferase n=1 Tax=Venturia effusa TaxID=50376 RepID=A0A517L074_9PEZI|nr:hypothetical protein FKW77_009727 [Venturia effusa]